MATSEEFVQKMLEEQGDKYDFGFAYPPGTPPSETQQWDCSGIIYTKLNELGLPAPRNSAQILAWCQKAGLERQLEFGVRQRGALLYMIGHIGVSLGDGRTIESTKSKGVAVLSATYNKWTTAALVPGLRYVTTYPASGTPKTQRPSLEIGARSDRVKRLQSLLAKHNFDPGPIDGIFGKGTQAAVIAFQESRGLKADGTVDAKTWARLRGRTASSRG